MSRGKTAIVLTGGGARGAYQAGALKAIAHITSQASIDRPFDIFVGNSAGALNSCWMVSNVDSFESAANQLAEFWENLTTDQVFRTDFKSLFGRGARWIWELSTGGLHNKKVVRSLLDTSPLFRLIIREIDFERLHANIRNGLADAVALTAVNYTTGNSRVFHYTNESVSTWKKVRRDSIESELTPKHVMASSAIPILFPPVRIGDDYFGDGSLRNYTPLSPAIHLGAHRIFVIGVRAQDSTVAVPPRYPSLARILSVILNFVILDAVDYDLDVMNRVNQLQPPSQSGLRPIEVLMARPNDDLGQVAMENVGAAPPLLRYLIRGLGTDSEASDLISYLLFEPPYLTHLVRMGYDDTINRRDEILDFLS